MMKLEESLGDHQSYYNLSWNMCTKCHRNPSNSCQDISLKDLVVALEVKSGDQQSHYTALSGNDECLNQTSWQSINWMFRYFSLDQSGGPKRDQA